VRAARDALRSALPNWQALPSLGMAEDIARAAIYLASDASSFMNGHNLILDGGITAGRPASVMLAERASLAASLATSLAAASGRA
jgi:hypothetical protein